MNLLLGIISLILLIPQQVCANTDYSVGYIADSLLVNANGVIRNHHKTIAITKDNEMIITEKMVVTILNSKANYLSAYQKTYDDNSKIKELSAILYNGDGKVIKKFKKKDFLDFNVGGGDVSITDTRVKLLSHSPTSYPYTCEFYSVISSGNTGFIPAWDAAYGFNISIEESYYEIMNDSESKWSYYVEPGQLNKSFELVDEGNYITATIRNVTAISSEDLCPEIDQLLPMVKIGLHEFYLHGEKGYSSDWDAFGRWYYNNLLNQNLSLKPEVVQAIKELTVGVTDPIERAKIVYDYVQNRTRYISVQLGIGGWKPTAAQEVHDLGYGDCKGLTHYTRALLDAVDVSSNIAIVYAGKGKQDLSSNLASMQGNHVIICIPQEQDSVWLECTSQSSPFGYIGDFTDDRDVLMVGEQGGKIVRTKAYTHEDNIRKHIATINVHSDGSIDAPVAIQSTGLFFDKYRLYDYYDTQEVEELFQHSLDHLNRVEVSDIHTEVNKDNISLDESYQITMPDYARVEEEQLIFSLNPFNPFDTKLKRYKNRQLPFVIRDGRTYECDYRFIIPEGYELDYVPDNIRIDSPTGYYEVNIIDNQEGIIYERRLIMYAGNHSAIEYDLHRDFLNQVRKYDKLKISIKKQI